MSVQAMSWAIEQQRVTDPTARHVLLVLANYAGKTGRSAYPAVGTIARETGLSERTVQLKLKQLLAEGVIALGNQAVAAVDHEGKPRRNGYKTNVYDLSMSIPLRGEAAAPLRDESDGAPGVNLTARAGVNLTQSRGEAAAPDPKALDPRALKASKSLSKSQQQAEVALARTSENLSLKWPEKFDLDAEVVEDFRLHCEELRKPLTASAWKATCRDLSELWDRGVDLNEALRRTMQTGKVIPVDPTRGKQAAIDRRQRDQQRQVDTDVRMVERTMPPGVSDSHYCGHAGTEVFP